MERRTSARVPPSSRPVHDRTAVLHRLPPLQRILPHNTSAPVGAEYPSLQAATPALLELLVSAIGLGRVAASPDTRTESARMITIANAHACTGTRLRTNFNAQNTPYGIAVSGCAMDREEGVVEWNPPTQLQLFANSELLNGRSLTSAGDSAATQIMRGDETTVHSAGATPTPSGANADVVSTPTQTQPIVEIENGQVSNLGVTNGRIERVRGTPKGNRRNSTPRGRGRGGGRQLGHRNYTHAEIEKLFDVIEEVEPIGSNHWAQVWIEYSEWAKENAYSTRDAAMVKQKFDPLANENRPTGDPNCPPSVRRAKRFARAIIGRAQAIALGGTREYDDDLDDTSSGGGSGASQHVGSRVTGRSSGAAGVRAGTSRVTNEAALVACVSRWRKSFRLCRRRL